jgi:hypothetical protein
VSSVALAKEDSHYASWKVKFYAAFEALNLAQHFEQYLKSGSGHAFSKRYFGP